MKIMMLDLDHFKTFNYTYGHEAEEDLFREFEAMIRNTLTAVILLAVSAAKSL